MPRRSRHDVPAFPGDWADSAAGARPGAPDMAINSANASPAYIAVRRLVCSGCPVLAECKAWALTSPDPAFDHVAGGLTPAERSQTRRWGLR